MNLQQAENWWLAWRKNIQHAKESRDPEIYCRAAMIAQKNYVIAEAEYFAEVRP